MLQSDAERELEEFLKNTDNLDVIHLVLPGAVISGELIKMQETEHRKPMIWLQNATVYTGFHVTRIDELNVPYSQVLAWGDGEISSESPPG